MKKSMLIIITIASFIFGKTITTTSGLNVREKPSAKSDVISTVEKGTTLDVIEEYAAYIKVDVLGGTIHKGKTGWMWSERIDEKKGKVIIEGTTLRSSPEKIADSTPADTSDDHNFLAKVRVGADVKVIEKKIIWVMIETYDGKVGWISAAYCEYIN